MKRLAFILLIIFVFLNCSSGKKKVESKDLTPLLKSFISIESLENAGFKSFNPIYYNMLFIDESLYLLDSATSTIVKFKQTKPVKFYKESGQGPGAMLTSRSIFMYDKETIAVFDIQKLSVLFFDMDLNYKNEIRVNPAFSGIRNTGKAFTASGDFPDNILFANLDRNFNCIEKFLTADLSMPFKTDLPPQFFNRCYILNDHQVAYTYWLYLYKQCKVDIFDIDTKSRIKSLQWEQEYTPTKQDVERNTNLYSSISVQKRFKYYIVNCRFQKKIKDPGYYDILIFQEDGQLICGNKTQFSLIDSICGPNDTRIFFFDDDKGILTLDLKEL